MSDLCASAVADGTYDKVRSVTQVRDILNAREVGNELAQARWWANERVKLRVYLIAECWDKKSGRDDHNALVMPLDARFEMASRPWQRLPEILRHSIVNEMQRLTLSVKVMQGK